MKRLFCLLLTAAMCLSLSIFSASAAETAGNLEHFVKKKTYTSDTFKDVRQSDWFYSSVETVYETGLMEGKGSHSFDPNSEITVAETLAIAARLHAIYTTGTESFAASDPWYHSYGEYAFEREIARYDAHNNGIWEWGDNESWITKCDTMASRRLFAGILAKALPEEALAPINDIPDDTLPDVNMTDIYSAEIYQLYRAGILTGNDAYGTFTPHSSITRREVAAIISRMADPTQRKTVDLKPMTQIITGDCGVDTFSVDENGIGVYPGTNLKYTLDFATGELVISGEGNMSMFQQWGKYTAKIKTVIIEDGVTEIGKEAFKNCVNLREIVIPDSVRAVKESAFQNCKSLQSISLPDGISVLYAKIFYGCSSLKDVKLPANLQKIYDAIGGSYFFGDCVSLKRVELPDALTNIPARMFSGCTDLEEIAMPASLNIIYEHAFNGCTSLKTISIPESVELDEDALANWSGEVIRLR